MNTKIHNLFVDVSDEDFMLLFDEHDCGTPDGCAVCEEAVERGLISGYEPDNEPEEEPNDTV